MRGSERVDELQRCPLRANQLALRHHTPEMHAVGRNGADNGLEMQINADFDKDSQDSGNRVADAHHKIQHHARGQVSGHPTFKGVRAPTEGERSGSLSTPHREVL